MPNQSDPNQPSVANPPAVTPPAMDLPPLPQDSSASAQGSATPTPPASAPIDQGSAAPPETPIISNPPKKKFGGGRIIATILGVFLLVGGIGAGYVLTQQPQLLQPQAKTCADYGSAAKRNACLNGGNGPVECPSGMVSCGAANNKCTSYSECVTIGQEQNAKKNKETPNYSTDPNNCGGPNHVCPAGNGCVAGVCTSVNFQTDPNNCGNVGMVCQVGFGCTNGVCTQTSNASCGRNLDTGAPVCCGDTSCSGGSFTCEQGRKECNKGGKFCTIQASSPDCTGANPKTTTNESPSPSTPACLNVQAFSSTWTLLTSTNLSALASGATVNFCVAGSTGTFDQAQFDINAIVKPITTTKGQGAAATSFCQSYTILSTDTTVNVKAKIHDTTSSTWVGESF